MTRDNATHVITSSRSAVGAVAVLAAFLATSNFGAARAQALPPLTNTMYDKDMPPSSGPSSGRRCVHRCRLDALCSHQPVTAVGSVLLPLPRVTHSIEPYIPQDFS